MRAYCRGCDAAVEAAGAWPGRCRACRAPVEAHPVPDVVGPDLAVLFVGINPGVATARARRHFANPRNAFWGALAAAAFVPAGFGPERQEELPGLGLGITNVVTRATPGSADVAPEDVARGRARLAALVREVRPRVVAFVGKEAWRFATGAAARAFGEQEEGFEGSRAFVLPSTSPRFAAMSPEAKAAHFRALYSEVAFASSRTSSSPPEPSGS